jgi:hypothetical protein
MTGILESPLRGIMNSRYSEQFGRALGDHYIERALYNIYIYIQCCYTLNIEVIVQLYKNFFNKI